MRTIITLQCQWCGDPFKRRLAHFVRSGPNAYCSRECAGYGRRKEKSDAQKRAEKSEYDSQYRQEKRAIIKARKAEYFQRTYDPQKAAVERKKRMPYHVEYCRRPEYRAKKHEYDIHYNAKRAFGPFGEAFVILNQLDAAIKSRMSKYEIRIQQKTLNKSQQRKRALP